MENRADINKQRGLGDDTVRVWRVFVPGVKASLGALKQVLSVEERAKADRFRFEKDHDLSVAARGALRLLLEGYTGIAATELKFDLAENDKPFLAMDETDVEFNVSHSGDWVLLAFGRNRRVGVDVEKVRRDMDVESIASRFFAPEEVALIAGADDKHEIFCQLWARKEAYVKALGTGLFRALNSFSVPIVGNELPMVGTMDEWIFQALEAAPNYAAAVVTDREPVSVTCYDFGGLKWES
ncbi:MAG: 4'-phosphopantetheinyl transferase superfamily protein [Kiritimatiellales bacterium]|nr:4'-phosphopantetheinyl transferase superfamily protein [Kiritimatiellales bacterium]